jgi:hypothetical protein
MIDYMKFVKFPVFVFLFLEKKHECVDYLLKNWVYDTLFKINEIYHV